MKNRGRIQQKYWNLDGDEWRHTQPAVCDGSFLHCALNFVLSSTQYQEISTRGRLQVEWRIIFFVLNVTMLKRHFVGLNNWCEEEICDCIMINILKVFSEPSISFASFFFLSLINIYIRFPACWSSCRFSCLRTPAAFFQFSNFGFSFCRISETYYTYLVRTQYPFIIIVLIKLHVTAWKIISVFFKNYINLNNINQGASSGNAKIGNLYRLGSQKESILWRKFWGILLNIYWSINHWRLYRVPYYLRQLI